MTRTHSLEALFAALLVGCGPQVDLDDGDDGSASDDGGSSTSGASSVTVSTSVGTTVSTTTPTPATTSNDSWDTSDDSYDEGTCDDTVYSEVHEIPTSAIAEWLDRDGQVIREGCWKACSAVGFYEDIVGCRVLMEGDTDGLESDDGTPPPAASTSDGGSTTGSWDTDDDGWASHGDTDSNPFVLFECDYRYFCGGGRGHAALQSHGLVDAIDHVGRWAAEAAHSEAASVAAFLALHRELSAHGAPLHLLDRTLEAARDEVAHARVMTRIAARRGVRARRPRFGPVVVRDLETIAIENAVEGCVRETFAALEASHQGRAAADKDVRAAMQRIAVDETRHAELARDIDRWTRSRLSSDARRRVAQARAAAVKGLLQSVSRSRGHALRRHAGLPSVDTARRLAEGLRDVLWV